MASYNKMTVIGNLGGDPEPRVTPSDAHVTNFNVAVNDRRKNAEGQTVETTTWFRVTCWNKLAEVAAQYLKKGMQVYVEGPLQVRTYTGNDGQTRFSLEITAREFQMLTPRGVTNAVGATERIVNDTPIPDAPTQGDQGDQGELVGAGAHDDAGELNA